PGRLCNQNLYIVRAKGSRRRRTLRLRDDEVVDQRHRNDQRADDGGDGRGPADDALGHDVVLGLLLVVGVAAAAAGLGGVGPLVVVGLVGVQLGGGLVGVVPPLLRSGDGRLGGRRGGGRRVAGGGLGCRLGGRLHAGHRVDLPLLFLGGAAGFLQDGGQAGL